MNVWRAADTRNKTCTWAGSLSFVGCDCTAPVEVWVRDHRHVLNGVESYDVWREYRYVCSHCKTKLTRKGAGA